MEGALLITEDQVRVLSARILEVMTAREEAEAHKASTQIQAEDTQEKAENPAAKSHAEAVPSKDGGQDRIAPVSSSADVGHGNGEAQFINAQQPWQPTIAIQ